MAKTNPAEISAKLYELLEPLTSDERARAIQATLVLFGEPPQVELQPRAPSPVVTSQNRHGGTVSAFFEEKAPANKGEILAVAARYRELNLGAETHSKEELKKTISDARRNFDSANFILDIKNARRQAGFFNMGTKRDSSQLSYYGQQYVDALPDRVAAAKLKRPKTKRGGKARATKKSA